jgi:hypothetical protein
MRPMPEPAHTDAPREGVLTGPASRRSGCQPTKSPMLTDHRTTVAAASDKKREVIDSLPVMQRKH